MKAVTLAVAAYCGMTFGWCAEESAQNQGQDGAATTAATPSSGKLEDVVVKGKDALKIEREKQPLELDLDYMKIVLPTLETGKGFVDKLSEYSVTVVKPVYQPSLESEAPVAPWLTAIIKGPVATFQLEREKTPLKKWEFVITDTHGNACRTFTGAGALPASLTWDGRDANGQFLKVGNTYSYVLVVTDKAGNRRSTIGRSFVIAAAQHQEDDGLVIDLALAALFDAKKDALVLVPGGRQLLREASDTIKEYFPLPFSVKVRAETDALAQQQMKVLADYFAGQLSIDGSRITVAGYEDVPENYHASIVIKNRKEMHQ